MPTKKPDMSISELHENGTMTFLVQHGLITPSVYRRLEIFVEVKNLENQGVKRAHAVEQVSVKCKVCERSVWRALSTFRTD